MIDFPIRIFTSTTCRGSFQQIKAVVGTYQSYLVENAGTFLIHPTQQSNLPIRRTFPPFGIGLHISWFYCNVFMASVAEWLTCSDDAVNRWQEQWDRISSKAEFFFLNFATSLMSYQQRLWKIRQPLKNFNRCRIIIIKSLYD